MFRCRGLGVLATAFVLAPLLLLRSQVEGNSGEDIKAFYRTTKQREENKNLINALRPVVRTPTKSHIWFHGRSFINGSCHTASEEGGDDFL